MFLCLKGWRNERYCVHGSRSEGVIMQLERAAVGLLGVRAYGCHLNGYTRTPEGQVKMWIAKRSDTKQTYPGMLDNLVGGGLATTTNPLENIIKECGEEAGLDIAAAFKVVSTGVLCFFLDDSERGWVPDTEWVYDLELPSSFDPQPVDGEVQAFHLWDLETVKEHLHKGEFMNESALVVIDFLIRFGLVTAMNEPDYIEIVARMHRSLPQPGPRFGSK
ncbi:NUDIX hydrolase domain-like protein [Powellomyces hirtus]|nr:NUDIX hydrolase domain-like protein [Powellomyces hirtus]